MMGLITGERKIALQMEKRRIDEPSFSYENDNRDYFLIASLLEAVNDL